MEWSFDSDRPVYSQLTEQIVLRIINGVYLPGEKLPAVRELAAEAMVNPNTVQRAFSELEGSALIVTQRTAGRFITDDTTAIEAAKRRFIHRRATDFSAFMSGCGYTLEQTLGLLRECGVPHNEAGSDSGKNED